MCSKRNSYRMTPTGGRSRTASESNPMLVTSTTTLGDECLEVMIYDEAAETGRLPDVVAEIYGTDSEPVESYLAVTIQVFIPFLIAGLGMVGAGLVLDLVQVSSAI